MQNLVSVVTNAGGAIAAGRAASSGPGMSEADQELVVYFFIGVFVVTVVGVGVSALILWLKGRL